MFSQSQCSAEDCSLRLQTCHRYPQFCAHLNAGVRLFNFVIIISAMKIIFISFLFAAIVLSTKSEAKRKYR